MLGGGAGRVPSGSAKTPRARLLLLPCQLLPRQWRWASNPCQHYSSIDSLTSPAISHRSLCNVGRIHDVFGGWLGFPTQSLLLEIVSNLSSNSSNNQSLVLGECHLSVKLLHMKQLDTQISLIVGTQQAPTIHKSRGGHEITRDADSKAWVRWDSGNAFMIQFKEHQLMHFKGRFCRLSHGNRFMVRVPTANITHHRHSTTFCCCTSFDRALLHHQTYNYI